MTLRPRTRVAIFSLSIAEAVSRSRRRSDTASESQVTNNPFRNRQTKRYAVRTKPTARRTLRVGGDRYIKVDRVSGHKEKLVTHLRKLMLEETPAP